MDKEKMYSNDMCVVYNTHGKFGAMLKILDCENNLISDAVEADIYDPAYKQNKVNGEIRRCIKEIDACKTPIDFIRWLMSNQYTTDKVKYYSKNMSEYELSQIDESYLCKIEDYVVVFMD